MLKNVRMYLPTCLLSASEWLQRRHFLTFSFGSAPLSKSQAALRFGVWSTSTSSTSSSPSKATWAASGSLGHWEDGLRCRRKIIEEYLHADSPDAKAFHMEILTIQGGLPFLMQRCFRKEPTRWLKWAVACQEHCTPHPSKLEV